MATKGAVTAIIIAVVAVLDTNIEKVKVIPMTPKRIMEGLLPHRLRTHFESQLSRPVRAAAEARTNPPKNNQMTGLAQGSTNIFHCPGSVAKTPPGLPKIAISRPIASSATAKAGMASVIHSAAAKTRMNSVHTPASESPA